MLLLVKILNKFIVIHDICERKKKCAFLLKHRVYLSSCTTGIAIA